MTHQYIIPFISMSIDFPVTSHAVPNSRTLPKAQLFFTFPPKAEKLAVSLFFCGHFSFITPFPRGFFNCSDCPCQVKKVEKGSFEYLFGSHWTLEIEISIYSFVYPVLLPFPVVFVLAVDSSVLESS